MPGAAVADAVAGRIAVLDTYVGVAAVQERALDACCVNACARMLPALWCLSATADADPSLSPGNIGMLKLRLRPPGPRSRPPLSPRPPPLLMLSCSVASLVNTLVWADKNMRSRSLKQRGVCLSLSLSLVISHAEIESMALSPSPSPF